MNEEELIHRDNLVVFDAGSLTPEACTQLATDFQDIKKPARGRFFYVQRKELDQAAIALILVFRRLLWRAALLG